MTTVAPKPKPIFPENYILGLSLSAILGVAAYFYAVWFLTAFLWNVFSLLSIPVMYLLYYKISNILAAGFAIFVFVTLLKNLSGNVIYITAWCISGFLGSIAYFLVFFITIMGAVITPPVTIAPAFGLFVAVSILLAFSATFLTVLQVYKFFPNLEYTRVNPYLIGFGFLGATGVLLNTYGSEFAVYTTLVSLLFTLLTAAKFSEWEKAKNIDKPD